MRPAVRYFAPGPVWVHPEVRRAMTRDIVPHRSPGFKKMWRSIGERLGVVFRTDQPVLVATSSATFALEAALVSLAPRRVLSLTNGAFSERWREIARSHRIETEELAVPWGRAIDPASLRTTLRRSRPDVVTVVHCETSTGVLNPIEDLARVVREESGALVLVDGVSSVAGARVETDDWGLDLIVTGSQKALGLPPGLALFSASSRLWERISAAREEGGRGFYTDFLRYRDKHAADGPITTPAIPLIYALDAQLDRILEEGVEQRWLRHETLRQATAIWAESAGFEYASDEGARSPTVSCFKAPSEPGAADLVNKLARRGFVIGGGYGRFKNDSFRIGHMAEVGSSDLELLFEAIGAAAASENQKEGMIGRV